PCARSLRNLETLKPRNLNSETLLLLIRRCIRLLLIWTLIGSRLLIFLIRLRNFLPLIQNLHVRSEAFVVFILHDLADMNVVQVEVQRVIGAGVGGKPIFAVDLLPPGGELWIQMFFLTLLLRVASLGHSLAVGFYDLEVVIVNPDPPLEIPLLPDNLLGSDVEYVAAQLVFRLLTHVKNVVFRNFVGGENKRQPVAKVLHIALVKRKPALFQARLRRENHVLNAVALVVKQHVENFVILAGGGAPIQGLYCNVLPVGVLVARLFEFLFLSREVFNDFFGRDPVGRLVF